MPQLTYDPQNPTGARHPRRHTNPPVRTSSGGGGSGYSSVSATTGAASYAPTARGASSALHPHVAAAAYHSGAVLDRVVQGLDPAVRRLAPAAVALAHHENLPASLLLGVAQANGLDHAKGLVKVARRLKATNFDTHPHVALAKATGDVAKALSAAKQLHPLDKVPNPHQAKPPRAPTARRASTPYSAHLPTDLTASLIQRRTRRGGSAASNTTLLPRPPRSAAPVTGGVRAQAPQPGGRRIRRKLTKAAGRTAAISGPLSPEQKAFAAAFAKSSGLSPRVAAAAVLREGGNNTPGDNNWLNIGWTDSGQASITKDPVWRDPVAAGHATGKWINGRFGQQYGYVASPGIQSITRAQGDQAQMQAWANSGWASSGASPADTYGQVSASSKPIPGRIKRRAVEVLGRKATRRIIGAAQSGGAVGGTQTAVKLKQSARHVIQAAHGGVHLRFEPIFAKALVKLARLSGDPIVVNSGFRTLAEQKAAYADYQAGGTLAAVPGTSNHEFGRAADLQLTDKQRSLLGKAGLSLPVPGEDWHVELSNPKARARAGYGTSSGGGTVSLGGGTVAGGTAAPGGATAAYGASAPAAKKGGGGGGAGSLTPQLAALLPANYRAGGTPPGPLANQLAGINAPKRRLTGR